MINSQFVLLTKSTTIIIGQLADLLGLIMNGIYDFFFNTFGIESIGFSIIVFTIITRILMLPLAIKQQQSSIAMQKIQPEMKKIQNKYKNKKDRESQTKMQMEMQKLYKDNNANPVGGCLPLLVQMPVMFALFAVLRRIPAYIVRVNEVYQGIIGKVQGLDQYESFITTLNESHKPSVSDFDISNSNSVIDVLSQSSATEWVQFKETFSSVSGELDVLLDKLGDIYNFIGINLSAVPVDFSKGAAGIMTVGLLIPILCFLGQLASMRLTMAMTPSSGNGQQQQTQKTMMYMMPFITLIFVFQMPAGLGLYWLTGSVFQIFQTIAMKKFVHEKKA